MFFSTQIVLQLQASISNLAIKHFAKNNSIKPLNCGWWTMHKKKIARGDTYVFIASHIRIIYENGKL